jgi:hypothetical protein
MWSAKGLVALEHDRVLANEVITMVVTLLTQVSTAVRHNHVLPKEK